MPHKPMRGVFPILVTPFDEKSRIDEESLRSLVEFNIGAGVHGLGVALGSEVLRLSEAERVQVTRLVVDQARARVPIVVNTGAQGSDVAVLYSRTAQDNGASALMVMLPSGVPAGPAEAKQYFTAISDAVSIPIFIQDIAAAPVSAGLARQIVEEAPNACYIKVETPPLAMNVAAAVAAAGGRLTVFGGAGGSFFIEEMRRGSVGTMPSCSVPEAFVEVWDRFQAGDEKGARAMFMAKILPVNRIAEQGWGAFYHVHKEILRRRGVIRTSIVRGPIAPLDETTARELKKLIDEIYGQS
jgi:dihydrodipicolinate synthase/N-acetylneuraminate lyase